ncbi:MAG: hypothetical protein Q8M16_08760 [Pirellulaceae bacterium]|nr:hypothetical protein [Pirellulaceae bacterium]
MFPAVPPSDDLTHRAAVELVLAEGWRYNSRRRVFVSDNDELFRPPQELLAYGQLVYKVPTLAKQNPQDLSAAERDLQRYMQLILPPTELTATLLENLQAWPCIEAATPGPKISLPKA